MNYLQGTFSAWVILSIVVGWIRLVAYDWPYALGLIPFAAIIAVIFIHLDDSVPGDDL